MIEQVMQAMNANGWDKCIQNDLLFQEKGMGVNLDTSPRGSAIKIKVDGCLITNTKKCDCLYFYEHSKNQHYIFLVELKGTHFNDALEQLAATFQHPNYITLATAANANKKPLAVALVGAKAKTNRPNKDEWEDENNLRLIVKALDRGQTYNLRELARKE